MYATGGSVNPASLAVGLAFLVLNVYIGVWGRQKRKGHDIMEVTLWPAVVLLVVACVAVGIASWAEDNRPD